MKPENVTCPVCEGPMTPRSSQYGKFWGCNKYPKCKGTRNADGEARRSGPFEDGDGVEPYSKAPSDRQRDNDRRRW